MAKMKMTSRGFSRGGLFVVTQKASGAREFGIKAPNIKKARILAAEQIGNKLILRIGRVKGI